MMACNTSSTPRPVLPLEAQHVLRLDAEGGLHLGDNVVRPGDGAGRSSSRTGTMVRSASMARKALATVWA